MKKCIIIFVIMNLFVLGIKFGCFSSELFWQNIGRENSDLRAVLTDPDYPNTIYAGSGTGIIKSEDGGANWRDVLSIRGKGCFVNYLAFGFRNKNELYAATGNGLFYSFNKGESWKRIFQGKDYLENECSSIAVLPAAIYLGTKAGLFISRDNGRRWHKEKGKIGDSSILVIAYNKNEPDYIYVACADGVFKAKERDLIWERIFVAHTAQDSFDAEEEAEEKDEESRFGGIRYINIDPVNTNCLYVAASTGIYKSCDGAKTWESVSTYGLLNREVEFLLFSDEGALYAITKSGIFEYGTSRWRELSFSLAAGRVRFLALDNRNNLYAACDKGLFKATMVEKDYNEGGPAIGEYYKDEPKIKEVQQAAIKYAEVEQGKIKQWRKQAAKKAILPQLSLGVDRNTGDLWHWETGSSAKSEDDVLRKGRDNLDWGITLSWDLGELIWNNDQTSIDVRSRLMVELRDDILDEVTKLYFERIRVKMEINNLSIEDKKKRLEKELKLQELTASLDALTGGYFSSRTLCAS